MRKRVFMEEHYTVCQHSTPFVLNCLNQCLVGFEIHLWRYCGPFLHELDLQHSVPAPENSWHQCSGRNVCLNFFSFFGECVCIQCFDCYLVSTFTNETQVKTEAILCVLCAPVGIFGTSLAQNL
jgi:hypothetical protein